MPIIRDPCSTELHYGTLFYITKAAGIIERNMDNPASLTAIKSPAVNSPSVILRTCFHIFLGIPFVDIV